MCSRSPARYLDPSSCDNAGLAASFVKVAFLRAGKTSGYGAFRVSHDDSKCKCVTSAIYMNPGSKAKGALLPLFG